VRPANLVSGPWLEEIVVLNEALEPVRMEELLDD
jgi:hypothetical protein